MITKRLFQFFLLIGAAFYAFEFFIHFWGLPILQHDKIFLPTHDRYIALYGLTYAVLLALLAWKPEKHRELFILTMAGILAGFLNASWIAKNNFYTENFNVPALDADLSLIGYATVAWYIVVASLWFRLCKKLDHFLL